MASARLLNGSWLSESPIPGNGDEGLVDGGSMVVENLPSRYLIYQCNETFLLQKEMVEG
ncbi:MAG: hypothetical protein ICV82_07525 [Nitrososphaera sp.]|nr:hypothetical protein [Nitrososphaera sp.]